MAGAEMTERQRDPATPYGLRRARPLELGWVLANDGRRLSGTRSRAERERGRGTDWP